MSRRRRLLIIALLLVVVAAAAVVTIHLPGVQRAAWSRVTTTIAELSGYVLEADTVALRFLPARFEAEGLRVSHSGQRVAEIGRLVAGWRWRGLLSKPVRIETLVIEDPLLDVLNLPPSADDDGGDELPVEQSLHIVEVGSVRLTGGSVLGAAEDVEWTLAGLAITGSLEDGAAAVGLTADEAVVLRGGRRLTLGAARVAARADDSGVRLQELVLDGEALRVAVSGSSRGWRMPPAIAAELAVDASPAELIAWWDPELTRQIEVVGRLVVEGRAEWRGGADLDLDLRHTGAPLSVAGIDIDTFAVATRGGGPVVQLAGSSWGRAEAGLVDGERIAVGFSLERARLDGVAALLPADGPYRVPGGVLVSGSGEATVPLTFAIEEIMLAADLSLLWRTVELRLLGHGNLGEITLEEVLVATPAGQATAAGSLAPEGPVDLAVEVDLADPGRFVAGLAEWWPAARDLGIGGGPVTGTLEISGTFEKPVLRAAATWDRPQAMDLTIGRLDVRASGDLGQVEWNVNADVVAGTILEIAGATSSADQQTAGSWSFASDSPQRLVDLAGVELEDAITGVIQGTGGFGWDGTRWRLDGQIEAAPLAWGPWQLDIARLDLEAGPDRVHIRVLDVLSEFVRASAAASFPLADLNAPMDGRVEIVTLDLAGLPIELPAAAVGTMTAWADLHGTPKHPVVAAELDWEAAFANAPVSAIRVEAAVVDGVLSFVSRVLETAAGRMVVEGEVPLGQVAQLQALWPDALTEPIRIGAQGPGLRSAALVAALGLPEMPAEVEGDLKATVVWDLRDPERRLAEVSVDGLVIRSDVEDLRAEGPLKLSWQGDRVVVEDFVLAGQRSRIQAGGTLDLGSREVAARADLELAPGVARLLPMPVQITGPIRVTAEITGPVGAPDGAVLVDHSGGLIVMRDPAVEMKDLQVEAVIADGVVSIRDGSAALNTGTLLIGGGWDPGSGQGIILELKDVALLLPYGILSRWNGLLSIEPEKDRLARVVGDLQLEGGLWDRPLDYAGALLGPAETAIASDDPLHDIVLDLEVRGRQGIRVDNNLGTFDVAWDLLHIGGTAALPVLRGDVRIPAGGIIKLVGRPVEVSRGLVEFSGEPGAEPRIEIVPVKDVAAFGDSEGPGIDATTLATKSLASGLGSVLGLENETLQPAEIAIETETDPASRFAVGQRLSRNLALIVTTDLSNVQDYQTMVQLWNLRGLKGLALQVFQETKDDVNGAALIERIQWGGTAGSDDQPKIHKVKLEGEWPISKWRLKRALGLAKGQPYDPFLLFASDVRLEEELAGAGYVDARVTAKAVGDERFPALVFGCEPGPYQAVQFRGDTPPKALRKQITASYKPPPLEGSALRGMVQTLDQHFAASGYPDAQVSAEREGEIIVVRVERGEKKKLLGPVVEGVPPDSAYLIETVLGGPAELTLLAEQSERAERIVRRLLRNKGFYDLQGFRVWAVTVDEGTEEIHVAVDAGPVEQITEIGLVGDDPLGMLESQKLAIREGMALDRPAVDRAVLTIRRRYREAGYADVEVHTWFEETDPLQWTLWFELDPGRPRTVTEIEFTGLRHLRESVLRKGLLVEEGGLLRTSAVDASAVQIATFAPVERISIETIPTGVSGSRMEIAVTEKPRWTVGLGARWRTDRGMEALVDLRDEGLFGRGVGLALRGRWEASEQQWYLLTSMPPLPGGRLSTSFGLSYFEGDSKTDPEAFREESMGATVEASYRLFESSVLRAYYKLADTVFKEQEPDPDFPIEWEVRTATIGTQFITDRMDDPFDPRSGYYFAADLTWSDSALGSDLNTIRTLLTGSLATAPRKRWTWAQTLRVGAAESLDDQVLDPTQRFFAGGQASVRGFRRDYVGPLTEGSQGTLVPQGGGALFVLNEELRIPVWKGLRVAVFADAGQVWEDWSAADLELSVGAGLGLRYATPIGPLWADIAWPVVNRGASSGYKFYFGIGKPF